MEKKIASITLADKTKKELHELRGIDDSFRLFELFDKLNIDMSILEELQKKHQPELDKINKLSNTGTKEKRTKEIRGKMAKDVAIGIANIVMRKSYLAKGLISKLIGASFKMTEKEVAENITPEFLTLAMTMVISKNYSAIVGFFMSNNA